MATLEEPPPPKSYAEAVERVPPVDGDAVDGDVDEKHDLRTASVMKIVDTGAPARGELGEGEDAEEEREEGTSYTPSSTVEGSRGDSTSNGHDGSLQEDPTHTQHRSVAQENNHVQQDLSNLSTEEKILGIKKTKSNRRTELRRSRGKTMTLEEFEGVHNGIKLTTVKPADDYAEQLETDRNEDILVSGRRAGQGWEKSGIRFAPLNVPIRRRLQTMMVLFHTLSIAAFVSIFFFLCAIPLFWPLLIPYMIYCMLSTGSTNGTLSHRSEFLRSLSVWSLFASYFPARLHRSEELPATRKYIFGYHPHGIISHGAFSAFATEALGFKQLFPGIRNTLLTLDSNFRIPIYRDYALAMGLASVSKESCENLLSKGGPNNEGMGRAITIVVGGASESLDAQPHSLRLVLKRRKGFVKMAIRTGADLVPVLAFGENDLYDQFQADSHPRIHKLQLLAKKILGFTIPLFHARGVFNYDVGLMPYRRPLNVVVGKPIRVVQEDRPGQESINTVHAEYVRELERLWDSWKDEFATERQGEMQIIE